MRSSLKNFNIIEITLTKNSAKEEKIHAVLLIKKKKIYFESSLDGFIESLMKNLEIPNNKIKFFCVEPAILLSVILKGKLDKNEINLKYKINKLNVYSFEFEINKKLFQIQNLNKIVNENTIQEIDPNFKFRPLINYSLDYENLRYTLPEGVANWEEFIKRSYTNQKKKYNEDLEEIKKNLYNNIFALEKTIKILNINISMLLKNWSYYLSISSMSISIFELYYNTHKINLTKKPMLEEKLREGLFGGRCEIFGNPYYEKEKILYFDFPSMYLNIMKESSFPIGDLDFKERSENIKKQGFYKCRVFSDINLPVLPSKEKNNKYSWENIEQNKKSTIFANGEFEGIYYSEELKLFEKMGGRILEIKENWTFKEEKKELIFKNFAENIINLRKIGNSNIWKSIGVSLYGRLGMKESKTETLITNSKNYKEDSKEKNILKERWIKDICFLEIEKIEKKNILSGLQYAIIIASLARIKLYKNLYELEKQNIRILYCDTDSIFIATPKNINENKIIEDISWNFNKSNIKDAVFANARTYSILYQDKSWETKISGNKRNSIDFESFKKKFYSFNHNAVQLQSWKRNLTLTIEWQEDSIINLNKYQKRKFSIDKKKTFPLIVNI